MEWRPMSDLVSQLLTQGHIDPLLGVVIYFLYKINTRLTIVETRLEPIVKEMQP